MANSPSTPRGRYAPSPSGLIHVGNARTALVAWLSVRSRGGSFVWRLEDLDPPRVLEGAAEAALADLEWLGLDWDEGPTTAEPERGGPFGPYRQSLRGELYEDALRRLDAAGHLFPCRWSRRDLRDLAMAPHGRDGLPPYPARLRPKTLPEGWLDAVLSGDDAESAVRFRVDPGPVTFRDRVQGPVTERVDTEVGDFVLRRKDGLFAYQLAVVVDDLAMEIDDVVRGADLLESTARQIQLLEALGGTAPAYAHVPLVLNAEGEKLSKRDDALTLVCLREAGVDPRQLVGYLAWSLGLLERPRAVHPRDLTADFTFADLRLEDFELPEDLPSQLRAGPPGEAPMAGRWRPPE